MSETSMSRSETLAGQFEASLGNFIGVVESLTSEQWRTRGRNTPGMRINDEDEARPLGVIAPPCRGQLERDHGPHPGSHS